MARSEYRRCPPRPAAPVGRPGSDRVRGQPHRHIAAANEGLIVGRPVRNAVLRLIPGMNLRLHPCSVAPAETRRAGQTAPPAEGLSCNNDPPADRVVVIRGLAAPPSLSGLRARSDRSGPLVGGAVRTQQPDRPRKGGPLLQPSPRGQAHLRKAREPARAVRRWSTYFTPLSTLPHRPEPDRAWRGARREASSTCSRDDPRSADAQSTEARRSPQLMIVHADCPYRQLSGTPPKCRTRPLVEIADPEQGVSQPLVAVGIGHGPARRRSRV